MTVKPPELVAVIVPSDVSIVAVYFFALSICIAGGAENCLGAAEDTGPPWAASEAAADGDAAGLGSGLDALAI